MAVTVGDGFCDLTVRRIDGAPVTVWANRSCSGGTVRSVWAIGQAAGTDAHRMFVGRADAVVFDVEAAAQGDLSDAGWVLEIGPARDQASPAFSGSGERLGGLFAAPAGPTTLRFTPPAGVWPYMFTATLYCDRSGLPVFFTDDTRPLVQAVPFRGGTCYWDVYSLDMWGPWSIAPA